MTGGRQRDDSLLETAAQEVEDGPAMNVPTIEIKMEYIIKTCWFIWQLQGAILVAQRLVDCVSREMRLVWGEDMA